MRAVVQRVSRASVRADGHSKSIGQGLLILLGVARDDTDEDSEWLVRKITSMRLFNDGEDKINLSLTDIEGDALVVSQFTLLASTRKGNRPSFDKAALPDSAKPLYNRFVKLLEQSLGRAVPTGVFGAKMEVELTNDGPVTIVIDSRIRE